MLAWEECSDCYHWDLGQNKCVLNNGAECEADPDPQCRQIKWTYTFGDGTSTIHYTDHDDTDDAAGHTYNGFGIYTVTVKVERINVSGCVAHEATCKVETVKVKSLLPDKGIEVNDGDNDPNTKSFVLKVEETGKVTVTATPEPNISESELPDCWSLTGGDGSSKLQRTVDINVPAKTVLECTCGTSSKTTRIYAVKPNVYAGKSEELEEDPGLYINVNWDDDDDDGWEPNDTPPDAVYTGDKDDPNIEGGDSDFRYFMTDIAPESIKTDLNDTEVSITFGGNVKVWETTTKLNAEGESSAFSSGTNIKLADLPKNLYLEGVSGSSEFKDVELKATYLPCDANDIVKITVFEVTLTGFFGFGDMQADNDTSFSAWRASSDHDGKISRDDANADGIKGDNDPCCMYFRNCMECQGTVKPSGVSDQVTFDFVRYRWGKWWIKFGEEAWELKDNSTPWTFDDPDDNPDLSDEDQEPSETNHIYHIDGPGWGKWSRQWCDYFAQKVNFREFVNVEIYGVNYQCSDYYKWHSQIYLKPYEGEYRVTRDSMNKQKLESSWIIVDDPNSP